MEPLSDVLALVKPRTHLLHRLDAGGEWSIQFPRHQGIKFDVVRKGSCSLQVEGENKPYHFAEGDCFLLTSGRAFVLASDLSLPAVDYREALIFDKQGVGCCGGGGDCLLDGGHVMFAGNHVNRFFTGLPGVIPAYASSNEASILGWALDLFGKEIRNDRPGGWLTAEHLGHIMLIQALRLHLHSNNTPENGWLSALGDPQLSAAISAMHSDVDRRWTLEEMAKTAGMSRSSFAEKFKSVVGSSPLEYLTRWRMQVAGARLRTTKSKVVTIAGEVGYSSEGAFSTAFKKMYGHSPRSYRAATRLDVDADAPEAVTDRLTQVEPGHSARTHADGGRAR